MRRSTMVATPLGSTMTNVADLARRESLCAIAQRLGRSTSTISREVKANGGRRIYRAFSAHNRAYRLARPKAAKLDHQPLAEVVTEGLEAWWSPKEIATACKSSFHRIR
jgi:IS30 family transposase